LSIIIKDSSAVTLLELEKNRTAKRLEKMKILINNVTKLKERVDSPPPKNFFETNLTQISSKIKELERQREVTAQEAIINFQSKSGIFPKILFKAFLLKKR